MPADLDSLSAPVQLARLAIITYLHEGEVIDPPANMGPPLDQPAACFVTLHTAASDLRGCIGTIAPTQATLAQEIVHNGIAAATRDPRFPPVKGAEMRDMVISVDVLNPPEPIASLAELDPKVYGVIVTSGHRRGLLLPDLDGVDTVQYQVAVAKSKAGIGPGEPHELSRFTVTRYH